MHIRIVNWYMLDLKALSNSILVILVSLESKQNLIYNADIETNETNQNFLCWTSVTGGIKRNI